MEKIFSKVLTQDIYPKAKPWAVIAALMAFVIVGFYTFEGWRYYQAWDQSNTMSRQITAITKKIDRGTPDVGQVSQNLELQEQRLAYFQGLFDYPDTGRLMGIVSETSWEENVDLPSISAADPIRKKVGSMEYITQSVTLNANGDIDNIYRFLAALQQRLQIVEYPNVSIANPGEEASAQIQLVFYLTPTVITDEEEEGAN